MGKDFLKKFLGNYYNFESNTFDAEKARGDAEEKKEKFNIILTGATGVGKSSLINSVFGQAIVKSGVGVPVTQHLEKIKIPEKGLILWDTKGIEAKDYQETISQLKNEIADSFIQSEHSDDAPHLAWLCIDASGARIEQRDFELIEIMKGHNIPVVVIFTKILAGDTDDFVSTAIKEINAVQGSYIKDRFVCVNSVQRNILGLSVPVSGMEQLLDISFESFREADLSAKNALKKAQMIHLDIRFEAMSKGAKRIVHTASVAAGTVGASPIPGSDAPIIAAIQSGMIYKINTEFELYISTATSASVIAGVLATTAIAELGKSVVSNVFKLIPGAGSVIGGVISAATAIAMTEAVGQAYIKVLAYYYNRNTGIVELPDNAKMIIEGFKKYLELRK